MTDLEQGLVGARIDPDWANVVGSEAQRIWEYNRASAEEIGRDVDLRELGGLVVVCTARLYHPEEVIQIAGRRSVVNVAFDEPGRLTLTEELLDAAEAQDRIELIDQLRQRQRDTRSHGPSEAWVLPGHALEVQGDPLSVPLKYVGVERLV